MLLEFVILVLCTIFQSLGLSLMRLSYLQPSDRRQHSVKLWRCGAAVFAAASLACVVLPLVVLPLILVCVVQSSACAINALFARFLLKERLNAVVVCGICLVFSGIGVVVYSAYENGYQLPISDPDLSLNELYKLLTRKSFVIWANTTLVLMALLLYRQLRNFPVRMHCKHRDVESGSPNASFTSLPVFVAWAWALCAGIAGAHSMMLGKLFLGIVMQNKTLKLADFERLQFWILGSTGLALFMAQMYGIAGGLRYASATQLYPQIYAVYTVTEAMNAMTLFGKPSLAALVPILCGSFLTILGVFLVFQRFAELSLDDEPITKLGVSYLVTKLGQYVWRFIGKSKQVEDTEPPSLSTNGAESVPTSPPNLPTAHQKSALHVPPPVHIPNGSPRFAKRNLTPNNRVLHPTALPSSPLNATSAFPPASPTHPQIDGDSLPLLSATTYTSFDSLSPSIVNPDKARGRTTRTVLSKEQHRILRELGM